jgi:hypothetical protein
METVLMPKKLTAKNGAKSLLTGEFSIPVPEYCNECHGNGCSECAGRGEFIRNINVPWTTIKEIYSMAVQCLSQPVNAADTKKPCG